MIIPSIDLENGQAVQLIGGKEKALDAGAPLPLAKRFRIAGEVAVIDLDAAIGRGSNSDIIKKLLPVAPCRVGGGIRDVETAIQWLDAGAQKIILGTSAKPEILSKLPAERVIAALDAENGEVVVEGWRKRTGKTILEQIAELKYLVGGFLVTFVEKEGRLGGTAIEKVEQIVQAAAPAKVTIAGGITTAEEIAALDLLGADAQVGMAIYTGKLGLADAIAAPLISDRPDGLWPTVVTDERGYALGLVYSDLESLRTAVLKGQGVYHSRSRGLWVKGETSGATQELLKIDLDCDRDALRFMVRQQPPGFCHLNKWSCFGEDQGLSKLCHRLSERFESAPPGSYTARLLSDPELLESKLAEEAKELAHAKTREEVAHEAADLLYFASAAMVRGNVSLSEVESVLDQRALKITRRPGDAKLIKKEKK